MLQEFKQFISRGNVIDLAVAVVMGAAFTGIINSLVGDILTPLIGVLMGGVDFSSLSITVGEAQILYGAFIEAVINFLIVAWALFVVVRGINRLQTMSARAVAEAEAVVESLTPEALLLTQIRDLLRGRSAEG